MKISFYGATREVTGSCYLVETSQSRVLIDCGMFQGSAYMDAKNFPDFDFDPSSLDAVLITHPHLDHVGRLPKLAKQGFAGRIYATPPAAKLAMLVVADAEHIMEDEYKRDGRPMLYDRVDVERIQGMWEHTDYSRKVKLGGLSFRFRDAGHVLGSSFVELEEAGGARVAFSGDLGNIMDPILRPTAQLAEQDALIIESTYGNRLHENMGDRTRKLQEVISQTLRQRGVLLIPAFAVERTQLLLYELNHLVENRLIPAVDIYLDSPLAIKASAVFQEYPNYYNKEALQLVATGDDLFTFPGLHLTDSRDASKGINEAPRPKIIIAGAGMMNAGRILHHLVRYLGDPKCTVLIIGYQANGTLGRRLQSGDTRVTVLNERIDVRARIVSLGSYSAHADQAQLLQWIRTAERLPGRVFCTHGEEDAATILAERITETLHVPASVPHPGDTIDV